LRFSPLRFSFNACISRFLCGQKFYETKPVLPKPPGILHDVCAILNEMHSQATRPNIVERTPAKRFAVCRRATITQHDFKSRALFVSGACVNSATEQFDRLARPISVGMADYVGKSFVDGAGQRAGISLRKAHVRGETRHGAANDGKDFGVARQLQAK
jgi:hypothetical protein